VARLAVLRLRDFRLLFASTTVSRVGNAFTSIALAFGILDATGSTQDIGIVLAFRTVAQVLLLLLGGAWGDRVSRRTLLAQSALVSAATQGGIAALFLTRTGALWSLSVLATVNGAAFAFSQPAATGVVPQLVPADLLSSANALISVMRNSATIAGSAAAGALVAVASPGWALAIDAVSYLASAVLVLRMSPLPPSGLRSGIWSELRDGWDEFRARTWVWAIVVQFTIFNTAYLAALSVYAPVVAKADLGGPGAYGVMTSALGIGGVLGGLVMLRYRPSRPLVSATIGVLVALVFYVSLAAGIALWAVAVAAVVSGVGVEVFSVLWESALQHYIPAERLSRVAAYDSLGSFAFIPLGLIAAGPLATAVGGLHPALWAMVGIMGLPTVLVLLVPDIWRLGPPRQLPEPELAVLP
jgi:MFS family permease